MICNFKNKINLKKYFPMTDYAKILKILIGTNLAFLVALIIRISPISICSTTILVVILGTNENTSRKYSFSRIISNFVGIPIVIFVFFILSKFTSLSSILKIELTLTISLAIALLLNMKFKFVTQWTGLAIAVLIITLSIPKNISYPILRIVQVFIGVVLGYLVNRFIVPVNYYYLASYKLKKVSDSLFYLLEFIFFKKDNDFLKNINLSDIKNELSSIEDNITSFSNDIKLKKYSSHKNIIPLMETLLSLCEEEIELIQISKNINLNFKKLNEDFLDCYLENLKNVMFAHKILLKGFIENNICNMESVKLIESKLIPINSEIEIILMSHVFEYGYTLNQAIKQNE